MEYISKLFNFENVVFPPQDFLSPSMIIKDVICSICHKNYDECDHVERKPYMGKLVSLEIKKRCDRDIYFFMRTSSVTVPYIGVFPK
jgi:hypothetical protein